MQNSSWNGSAADYPVICGGGDFSVRIIKGVLSAYSKDQIPAHWHDDIEILQILEGSIINRVNGYENELKKGDIIYINSRQFHLNRIRHDNCHYRMIKINPIFILSAVSANSTIGRLLKDPTFRFCIYRNDGLENNEISELISAVFLAYDEKNQFYELDVLSLVCKLFKKICANYESSDVKVMFLSDPDLEIQRKMLAFIYEHFSEKITLEQIASSGHISRSKCCKMFLQYLSFSPIGFLTDYRLRESCRLLIETDRPLSRIAQSCGFSEQSYYNRMFKRKYGCTPKTYRKSYGNIK